MIHELCSWLQCLPVWEQVCYLWWMGFLKALVLQPYLYNHPQLPTATSSLQAEEYMFTMLVSASVSQYLFTTSILIGLRHSRRLNTRTREWDHKTTWSWCTYQCESKYAACGGWISWKLWYSRHMCNHPQLPTATSSLQDGKCMCISIVLVSAILTTSISIGLRYSRRLNTQ
jgi:hypothetical protein